MAMRGRTSATTSSVRSARPSALWRAARSRRSAGTATAAGASASDRKRYYYYAHLRKDTPYAEGLAVGQRVQAGEVIGFMGRTGYSAQENVNNIETVHLHFGLQLIFDESQKECDSEIWIDVYPIIELLASHCSSVARDPQTGRWERLYPYCDLDAEPLRLAAAR